MVKMIYNIPKARVLLDRLETDSALRRICGWERKKEELASEKKRCRLVGNYASSSIENSIFLASVPSVITSSFYLKYSYFIIF